MTVMTPEGKKKKNTKKKKKKKKADLKKARLVKRIRQSGYQEGGENARDKSEE